MAVESFWEQVEGEELRQGDILKDCPVPLFNPQPGKEEDVDVNEFDVIIVTQSCDLEARKVRLVALCPITSVVEFEQASPQMAKGGRWESVRKGREEGLHLLSSPVYPDNNRECLVVDFREIYSSALDFLTQHAVAQGARWRLKSPYLEHFSQAFARFFMRVGLPSNIPPFK